LEDADVTAADAIVDSIAANVTVDVSVSAWIVKKR
jgi:hypothetical protein